MPIIVSDVIDIVNNQIDLNDVQWKHWKHLADNEVPNAEQTVNYQNAEDNAKTNFDDAKRPANMAASQHTAKCE